jgi:hypothetical protein
MLSDYRDAFLMVANAWSDALEANQADVKRMRLRASPFSNSSVFAEPLAAVKAVKVRVVLVLGPPAVLRTIALEASASGMVSAGWVWISDALCALVDAAGDTTQVRPLIPLVHFCRFWIVFRTDCFGDHSNSSITILLLCPGHSHKACVAWVAVLGSAGAQHGKCADLQERSTARERAGFRGQAR